METEKIRDLISVMRKKAKEEVPAVGDFEPVEVLLDNTDSVLVVDSFGLEVMQPPAGIEGHEIIRGLKVVAYKGDDGFEILIAVGTKQELLEKLNDDGIEEKIALCVEKINRELRHL